MASSLLLTARDTWDALRRARSPRELLRGVLQSKGQPLILNGDAPTKVSDIGDPAGIARELRRLERSIEAEAFNSGAVDYDALADSGLRETFRQQSQLLHSIDPATLQGDAARTAFWINVYNSLTLHGVLELGIRSSVMEVPSFFARVAYRVGPELYSLDTIEHGVLRRGAKHPATGKPSLTPDDPRLAAAPSHLDPRIHCGLVCAAESCPPIAYYDAAEVDRQLDLASGVFVSNTSGVDRKRSRVTLSSIFRYYLDDFGGHRGLEEFLLLHAEPSLNSELKAAFHAGFDLHWARYDWKLNGLAGG